MKLLFDENLSPRLPERLSDCFPESRHVEQTGLKGQPDQSVWNYAKENGFMIVSKDNDFRQRAFLYGAPPQVIWLHIGNAGTSAIESLLRAKQARIEAFAQMPEEALLVLGD